MRYNGSKTQAEAIPHTKAYLQIRGRIALL